MREDPGARRLWARHYEIGTDRPVFAGRDAVKRDALDEIERERRTGTAWYGTWPDTLLESDYPLWRERRERLNRGQSRTVEPAPAGRVPTEDLDP